MPVVRMPAGGENATAVVSMSAQEVGARMRRISDMTKKFRLRAHGGIGKAMPMKAVKGVVMKGRKAK